MFLPRAFCEGFSCLLRAFCEGFSCLLRAFCRFWWGHFVFGFFFLKPHIPHPTSHIPHSTSHFPVILLGPRVRGIAGLGEFLGLVSCGVEKNTILYKRHQSLVALHESAFHEVLIFETIESPRVFWYRTRRFLCNSGWGGRIDDGKIGISGRTKFCPDDGM